MKFKELEEKGVDLERALRREAGKRNCWTANSKRVEWETTFFWKILGWFASVL